MTETETISISSKPGIKCFPANVKVHDTFLMILQISL